MEDVEKWLMNEYKKADIKGLQINRVMSAIGDVLQEIIDEEFYNKKFPVSRYISVLMYSNHVFEVHVNRPEISTYNDFKYVKELSVESQLKMAREYLSQNHCDSEIEDIFANGKNIQFQHTTWHNIVVEGNLYSYELQTGAYDEPKQPWNGSILVDNGEDQFLVSTDLTDEDDFKEIILQIEKAIKELS